ncbi:MAG: family N-acetyltransferase [Rhodocyclaceae bacterium]|nr:family N-acetyltransferase [Rhodocyclaceae bacterium]
MPALLRTYAPEDREAVNALALAAFQQYRHAYGDWPAFSKAVGNMAALSGSGELIVAEEENKVVGAVAYIGPNKPKADFFNPEWPVMRMLVVHPSSRGLGIGRCLAEECIRLAIRDQAAVFALHTTGIMSVALGMYERMGFTFHRAAPPIHGVPYGIYLKTLRPVHAEGFAKEWP